MHDDLDNLEMTGHIVKLCNYPRQLISSHRQQSSAMLVGVVFW